MDTLLALSFKFRLVVFSIGNSLVSMLNVRAVRSNTNILSTDSFSVKSCPILFFE